MHLDTVEDLFLLKTVNNDELLQKGCWPKKAQVCYRYSDCLASLFNVLEKIHLGILDKEFVENSILLIYEQN